MMNDTRWILYGRVQSTVLCTVTPSIHTYSVCMYIHSWSSQLPSLTGGTRHFCHHLHTSTRGLASRLRGTFPSTSRSGKCSRIADLALCQNRSRRYGAVTRQVQYRVSWLRLFCTKNILRTVHRYLTLCPAEWIASNVVPDTRLCRCRGPAPLAVSLNISLPSKTNHTNPISLGICISAGTELRHSVVPLGFVPRIKFGNYIWAEGTVLWTPKGWNPPMSVRGCKACDFPVPASLGICVPNRKWQTRFGETTFLTARSRAYTYTHRPVIYINTSRTTGLSGRV